VVLAVTRFLSDRFCADARHRDAEGCSMAPQEDPIEPMRVDHWWTVGTTAGLFALARHDGATFTGTWRSADRVSFEVAFKARGKVRHIRGDLVNRPRPGDKFTWKYTRHGIALGGRVAVLMSRDERLCAVHLPANMMSSGGAVLLARPEVEHADARALIAAALRELDLSRSDFDNLVWRPDTTPRHSR
jgi:hypothetical protein